MLPEALKQASKEEAYRWYMAECLLMATENTAKFVGGRYMTLSFDELLHPKPVDNRTGDEIVADIIRGAGLTIVEEGGEEV